MNSNYESRVTAWLIPYHVETGKYGTIKNHDWLVLECERMREKGVPCEIISQTRKIKNKDYPDGVKITYEALFRKKPLHKKVNETDNDGNYSG